MLRLPCLRGKRVRPQWTVSIPAAAISPVRMIVRPCIAHTASIQAQRELFRYEVAWREYAGRRRKVLGPTIRASIEGRLLGAQRRVVPVTAVEIPLRHRRE